MCISYIYSGAVKLYRNIQSYNRLFWIRHTASSACFQNLSCTFLLLEAARLLFNKDLFQDIFIPDICFTFKIRLESHADCQILIKRVAESAPHHRRSEGIEDITTSVILTWFPTSSLLLLVCIISFFYNMAMNGRAIMAGSIVWKPLIGMYLVCLLRE